MYSLFPRVTLKVLFLLFFAAVVAITAAVSDVLGEDNTVAPTPWCFLRGDIEHEQLVYWHFGVVISWELMTYLSTSFLYLCLKFKMVNIPSS